MLNLNNLILYGDLMLMCCIVSQQQDKHFQPVLVRRVYPSALVQRASLVQETQERTGSQQYVSL